MICISSESTRQWSREKIGMSKKKLIVIFFIILLVVAVGTLIKIYIDTQDKVFEKGDSDKAIFYAKEYPGMWDSNSEYYKATVWKVYDNGKVIQYDEGSGGITTETRTWELSDEDYSRLRNILSRDFKECDSFPGEAFDGVRWKMIYSGEIYGEGSHFYNDYIYDMEVLEEIETILKR